VAVAHTGVPYKQYKLWDYEFTGFPENIDITKLDHYPLAKLEILARYLDSGAIQLKKKNI
jgi:hypothetical protein